MQSDSAAWLAEKICLPEQIYRGGKGRKRWTGRLLAETKVMSLGIIFLMVKVVNCWNKLFRAFSVFLYIYIFLENKSNFKPYIFAVFSKSKFLNYHCLGCIQGIVLSLSIYPYLARYLHAVLIDSTVSDLS